MSSWRKSCAVSLVLLLAAIPAAALAEEAASVYEVVSDISIGPVFLTPSQRAWLDQRRLIAPTPTNVSDVSDPDVPSSVARKKPAGYIVSSSGKRSEWSDGDFVESDLSNVSSMPFPGEVELLRHEHVTDVEKVHDDESETEE